MVYILDMRSELNDVDCQAVLLFSGDWDKNGCFVCISNVTILIPSVKNINGGARTLKMLHISKGDYWIKQWFSSMASLFKGPRTVLMKDCP